MEYERNLSAPNLSDETLMTLVRIDFDWVDEALDVAPPVRPGTYVGALIINGSAWYWHPETGHPWVSHSGDYTIMESR